MDPDMTLGQWLREHREELGLTGEAVARRAEWSPAKQSRVERDLTGISKSSLDMLLDILEVDDPKMRAYLHDLRRRR